MGLKQDSGIREKGIMALTMALLAMLIYIGFRFEWRFAVASVIGLVHDVIITSTIFPPNHAKGKYTMKIKIL